jgi:outer membrane immunogenic protein
MRRILALTILLAMTGAASAGGDYYLPPAPAPVAPLPTWAGPYLGATAGYQWGTVSNSGIAPAGVAGGIEGGYNWERGHFVFGGEADINISGADATKAPVEFSNPWFGTIRGRAGAAFGNFLFYGTGGLAYGDLRADTAGLSETHANVGWVAGAGAEFAFAPRWSAKGEWLYFQLAPNNFSVTGANNGLAANLLRFGVNYHF